MAIRDIFDADDGVIWVQPAGPGTTVYPLECHSTDGPTEPRGDTATRMCKGFDGKWSAKRRSQGLPGDVTLSITAYHGKVRSWLQRQKELRCPINIYLNESLCGREDVFLNYDAVQRIEYGIITNSGKTGMVRRMADSGEAPADATIQSFDLSGSPDAPEIRTLTESVPAIAEGEALRDIAFCNADLCFGPCGPFEESCNDGIIVADAAAAAAADVWFTTNNGTTWAAAAAAPYAIDMDITSATCFYIDRDTVRHVVARGTTDAGPADIAYTDDAGAVWTVVDVGTTNGEFAIHGGALFSLDGRHIWLCTDQGAIYFSDDYAITWTDQGAPTPVGGAEALYKIHFADENYGVCVGGTTGASSVYLSTTDGGAHWTLGTGPAAALLTGVHAIDSIVVWTVTEAGAVYRSTDYGVTWTLVTLPGVVSGLSDVSFAGEFDGLIVGFRLSSGNHYGIMYRTFNGGADWEAFVTTTTFDVIAFQYGYNAGWICGPNEFFGVGEVADLGLTGHISHLTDAGAS